MRITIRFMNKKVKINAKEVVSYRKSKNLTQVKFAELAGVSPRTLQSAEAGDAIGEELAEKILTSSKQNKIFSTTSRPSKDVGSISTVYDEDQENQQGYIATPIECSLDGLAEVARDMASGRGTKIEPQWHLTSRRKSDRGVSDEFINVMTEFSEQLLKLSHETSYIAFNFSASEKLSIGWKSSSLENLLEVTKEENKLMQLYERLNDLGYHILRGYQFLKHPGNSLWGNKKVVHFFVDEEELKKILYKVKAVDPSNLNFSDKVDHTLIDNGERGSYLLPYPALKLEQESLEELARSDHEAQIRIYPDTDLEKKWVKGCREAQILIDEEMPF
jgi:DNA-binding XRE family transcriptional regulator